MVLDKVATRARESQMKPRKGDAWVNDLRRKQGASVVLVVLIRPEIYNDRPGWSVRGIDMEDKEKGSYRIFEAFMDNHTLQRWYDNPDSFKDLIRRR